MSWTSAVAAGVIAVISKHALDLATRRGVGLSSFVSLSFHYSSVLNNFDKVIYFGNLIAGLVAPTVFLHFCLVFPERRPRAERLWLVPALYMPALVITGAAAMSQALFARREEPGALWGIVETIDAGKPLYFAALFAVSFGVLLRSYRRTRSLTARRQVKWLVWGTAAGASITTASAGRVASATYRTMIPVLSL